MIPETKVTVCRDPDDNQVIEAALAGRAECVVTGDEDLLSLKGHETVEFVTPRTFLARLDAAAQTPDEDDTSAGADEAR